MRNSHFFALVLALPLAACSAPVQDTSDATLLEIQDLYTPENPEVYTAAVDEYAEPQTSSELTSYRNSYAGDDSERWHGSIAFPIGFQTTEDFGEVDEAANFGLFDLGIQPAGSPVSLVVQLLASYSSEIPDENPTGPFAGADDTLLTQFNLGLRYVWGTGNVRPYFGGGASFVDASILIDDNDGYGDDELASDSDFAGWVGGGLHFTSRSGFLLGLNVQYLFGAEAELLGQIYDLDGLSAGVLIGYGF